MVTPFAWLAIIAFSAAICCGIARLRGAKASHWALVGALFGPIAIPFVFFSKPRRESVDG